MCGIFGVLEATDSRPDESLLSASAQLLGHRGPDACSTLSWPGIGLAHTRLSLLDPGVRSNQPMEDPSGRFVIAYNGEVYNFRELRSELEKVGATFLTTSDTEVVLQALIRLPLMEALRGLNGMFALIFHDRKERRTVIARDRFGMKPLWRCELPNGVMFASERKAFGPWRKLRPSEADVTAYLRGEARADADASFLEGVTRVRPGQVIELVDGSIQASESFFDLSEFFDAELYSDLNRESDQVALGQFSSCLAEAVDSQLYADAAVGAFCSGGVDSAVIAALASVSRPDLVLFHADVVGRRSEFDAAIDLSRALGLDMEAVRVEEEDFLRLLPRTVLHYEQPLSYHPNSVPLLRVAELVRDSGFKGVLSGEGADECFLGYPRVARRKIKRLVRGTGRVEGPSAEDQGVNETVDHLGRHLQTLLHRNDSLGMAAGVEARFPFLDHNVVRFAVNLPERWKLRWSPCSWRVRHPFVADKWMVRRLAARLLPKRIANRRKRGFQTDVYERVRLRAGFFEASRAVEAWRAGLGSSRAVDSLGTRELWHLAHLDVWFRVLVDGEELEHVSNDLLSFADFG